jgi:predicted transcriptional regulator
MPAVREIMDSSPATVHPDTPVAVVVALLCEHQLLGVLAA